MPWDMGMIGFWYNKALFEQAGITAPPATWDEYLAAVEKLRAAGIDPLAIAGKDKWPSMHLWTYLVLRTGGGDALSEMIESGNWNTPACTKAARRAGSGSSTRSTRTGGPQVSRLQRRGCTRSAKEGGHGIDGLVGRRWSRWTSAERRTGGRPRSWFASPTVAGRRRATDGVGGGNGIAVGVNVLLEALDFRKNFGEGVDIGRSRAIERRRPLDVGLHGGAVHELEPRGRPRGSR